MDASTDDRPDLASTASLTVFLIFTIIATVCALLIIVICVRGVLQVSEFFNWLLLCLTIGHIISLVCKGEITVVDMLSGNHNYTCNSTNNCIVSAAVSSFARMITYAWTLVIGWSCTLTILNKIHRFQIFTSKTFYSFLVWGGGIVIPVAGLIRGAYGRTDLKLMSLCSIRTCDTDMSRTEQLIWMMLTSKLWELLSYLMITNILFVGLCLRRPRTNLENALSRNFPDLNHLTSSDDSSDDSSSVSELDSIQSIKLFLWIPVCLLVCRIWTTLLFFMDMYLLSFQAVNEQLYQAGYYIQIIQAAFGCSPPTFNFALILMLHPEVRVWLRGIGRNMCSTCRSHP